MKEMREWEGVVSGEEGVIFACWTNVSKTAKKDR